MSSVLLSPCQVYLFPRDIFDFEYLVCYLFSYPTNKTANFGEQTFWGFIIYYNELFFFSRISKVHYQCQKFENEPISTL